MLESLDPSKDIVIKAYKSLLDRQPDSEGLRQYSFALSVGQINEVDLHTIIKNSDEYKAKNNYLTVNRYNKFTGKIVYTQKVYIKEVNNALGNISLVKSVDNSIECIAVCDDTVFDDEIERFKSIGAIIKQSPWLDDLPRQSNVALNEARSINAEWVLTSDPDEHFNQILIRNIRYIIQSAKLLNIDLIRINERNYDTERSIESNTDYFKDYLFEVKDDIYYKGHGNLPLWHEGIVGLSHSIRLPKEYYYLHAKSKYDDLEHYSQQMFTVGGGPNLGSENPTWVELRKLTDELGLKTWREFQNSLKKGNVNGRLKSWLIQHRNDNLKDGDQNARAMFQYYFMLHPEENTNNLTSIDFKI
jgi:hypothetical protein